MVRGVPPPFSLTLFLMFKKKFHGFLHGSCILVRELYSGKGAVFLQGSCILVRGLYSCKGAVFLQGSCILARELYSCKGAVFLQGSCILATNSDFVILIQRQAYDIDHRNLNYIRLENVSMKYSPVVFLHNSKSIGLRLVKFSDFSYIHIKPPLQA